jgi:hypothetical protein
VLWCSSWFPRAKDFRVVYATIYFVEVVALSILCVFIYTYWCPTPFPYQIMFVLFNSNTGCTTSGTGSTDPSGTSEFTTGFCFCSVRVAQSLFVGVVIWDHCLVIVSSIFPQNTALCYPYRIFKLFFHAILSLIVILFWLDGSSGCHRQGLSLTWSYGSWMSCHH